MNDQKLTPLFALAVSLAYAIQADFRTSIQEKAELVTIFGKLVEKGEFSKSRLERMTQDSFSHASATELSDFLDEAVQVLSHSQKLAILVNLYDIILVDGAVKEGERDVFKKFQHAFEIDEKTARKIREFLMLRHDMSLFTDPSHPYNDDDFSINSLFRDV